MGSSSFFATCAGWLDSYFYIKERGSSLRQELVAGTTTFLAMVYSIAVIPDMLASAGMDRAAAFTSTCLLSGFGSLLMGLWARLPLAIGCAISLSAFTAFNLVLGLKIPIPVVMGSICVMGLLFSFITQSGLRQWIMDQMPNGIAQGTGIGIGLFLLLIASSNVGLVIKNLGPGLPIQLGVFQSVPVLMTILGLAITIGLERRKVVGGILLVIVLISIFGLLFDPDITFKGVAALPEFGRLRKSFGTMDLQGALTPAMLPTLLALVLTAIFDATGTISAVAGQANLLDGKGHIISGDKALAADSVSNIVAGVIGSPPSAVYVESAAGIAAGGKTGLTAIVVGLLFFLMLFLAPLSYLVPSYATAPALLYVGLLMLSNVSRLDFSDLVDAMSGLMCAVFIAFSCSVVTGIMLGFCVLAVGRCISGELNQLGIGSVVVTAVLLIFYIGGWAI